MKRVGSTIWLLAVAALCACGRSSSTDLASAEPSGTTARAAEEVESTEGEAAQLAATRDRELALEAGRQQVESLARQVDDLRLEAEPVLSRLDETLRASLEELDGHVDGVRSTIERLATAKLDDGEPVESELARKLDLLRKRIGYVSDELQGQRGVLEKRREGERRPVTGLVKGLDGGDYEAYLVSVVRDTQHALRKRGYYPGPVDGYLGQPTMEALASFQDDHGLSRSGIPTPETRKRLLSEKVAEEG